MFDRKRERQEKYLYIQDPFKQQKELIKNSAKPIIFDVGAYRGDITNKYSALFSDARVYAFEPSKQSYEQLQTNVHQNENILTYHLALGNEVGTALLNINAYRPTNSLLPSHQKAGEYWGDNLLDTNDKEEVPLSTIDEFCKKHKVKHIDVLKIDTQGTESIVLEGAKKMLLKQHVSLIYMEIILVDTYVGQKKLPEITDFLAEYGYRLFNIYNPMISKKMELNQIDAIFVPVRK